MRLARAASRTSSEPLPTSPFWTRTRRGETVEIPSSSPGGTRNEVIELSTSSPDGAWEEGYGFLREASTSSDGGQEDRWWDHILEGERETEGMSETERNLGCAWSSSGEIGKSQEALKNFPVQLWEVWGDNS